MLTPTTKNESLIGKQHAEKVLELINRASKSIDIMMYEWRWYTNDPGHPIQLINHALVSAVRRGLVVRVLTDKAPISEKLQEVGIKARCLSLEKMMHSKMIIIDGEAVIMGSHNFTGSAVNSNIETSVLFYDKEVAEIKRAFFENLWR